MISQDAKQLEADGLINNIINEFNYEIQHKNLTSAIVELNSSHGVWQYTTDDITWRLIEPVSEESCDKKYDKLRQSTVNNILPNYF